MSSSVTQELRDLLGSYRFFAEMQRLAARAGKGEKEALGILDSMLAECVADPDWRAKSRWCSAAVRALVSAGTSEAMTRVLQYVRALPEDTPYGMVELLGGLLPGFGGQVLDLLPGLVESDSAPARAVAVQALCNFYLEGNLPPENQAYLLGVFRTFEPDRYLTQHLFELVKPGSIDRDEDVDHLAAILEDVIVETTEQ